jgi:cytochrome P450
MLLVSMLILFVMSIVFSITMFIRRIHDRASHLILHKGTREYLNQLVPLWFPIMHKLSTQKHKQLPFVGIIDEGIRMQQAEEDAGKPVVLTFIGMEPVIAVTDPRMVHAVLNNWQTYEKCNRWISKQIEQWIGGKSCLMGANGEDWMRQKKIISPAFNSYEEYIPAILQNAVKCLQCIDRVQSTTETAAVQKTVKIVPLIAKYTMDTMGKVIVNYDFEQLNNSQSTQKDRYAESIQYIQQNSIMNFSDTLIPWMKNKSSDQVEKHCHNIDTLINEMVDQAYSRRYKHFDEICIMDKILESNDEQVLDITSQELRSNCLSLFFDMQESTVSAVSFALYHLAKHPEEQDKLFQEIQETLPLEILTWSHILLKDMEHLNLVLMETLRLHPPTVLSPRKATSSQMIGDYHVPANTTIYLSNYLLHRDKLTWGDDADEFNPSRFLGIENSNIRKRLSYMPFGSGPRLCVGHVLVEIQVLALIALIVRYYTIGFVDPKDSQQLQYNVDSRVYCPRSELELLLTRRIESYQM